MGLATSTPSSVSVFAAELIFSPVVTSALDSLSVCLSRACVCAWGVTGSLSRSTVPFYTVACLCVCRCLCLSLSFSVTISLDLSLPLSFCLDLRVSPCLSLHLPRGVLLSLWAGVLVGFPEFQLCLCLQE